ncbi:MAG TPA: cytochrome c biogenesis protein ResB [Holophagaceae bacterium]|nr:cytochrome c biogenesis protein ResB [Holophagaceae bacterium]
MSDAATGSAPARKPFHLHVPLQLLALLAWCLAWCLAQSALAEAAPRTQILVFLAAGAVALGGLFFLARAWAMRLFTSVPFAISQLLFLAAAVLLGTLVVQGSPAPDYAARYGGGGWGGLALLLVRHAHAGDLFHSLWFSGLLLLIAASTLAVAWKRRPYPAHRLGFLMVHLAPSVILLGGLWGRFAAVRAFTELRVGEPAGTFWKVQGQDRSQWKDPYELPGFAARLDRFRIDAYEPEFKLYAYVQPDGKGGFESDPKAYAVKAGQEGGLPLTSVRYRVDQVLPNAVDAGQWVENPKAAANPAMQVLLGLGDGQPILGFLLARSPQASRFDEPGGRFSLLYRETFDPAEAAALSARAPRVDRLVLAFMGRTFEHEAKPGTTWDFPVFRLKILRLHPDFPFKQGPDGPVDLARLAPALRGPWAELLLQTQDGQEAPLFLSARAPGFTDDANANKLPPGLTLRYVHEGDEAPRRFALFTAGDHKVRLVEDGKVLRTEPIQINKPFVLQKGLSVTPLAELPHADWVADFKPNPDPKVAAEFLNPALKLTLTDPATGRQETRWLEAGAPGGPAPAGTPFLDGRVGMIYRQKEAEPRDFRSMLVIQDGIGRELARKEISVNDPLVFRGHWFYQSNYDPRDPGVSGIMVVREPGLGIIEFGFALLLAGTLWMFYLKPLLKKPAEGKGA